MDTATIQRPSTIKHPIDQFAGLYPKPHALPSMAPCAGTGVQRQVEHYHDLLALTLR
jgi:hypothetical protein